MHNKPTPPLTHGDISFALNNCFQALYTVKKEKIFERNGHTRMKQAEVSKFLGLITLFRPLRK